MATMPSKARLLAFSILVPLFMPLAVRAEKTLMPNWYNLQQDAYSLADKAKEEKLNQALVAARAYNQPDHYPESEVLF